MGKHWQRRWNAFNSCDRKVQFISETEAKSRIQSIRDRGGPTLRKYKCNTCGGWHLSSKARGGK
jgi:hypothetical protein